MPLPGVVAGARGDRLYEFLSGYGTLTDLGLRGIEPGGECARCSADPPLALVGREPALGVDLVLKAGVERRAGGLGLILARHRT